MSRYGKPRQLPPDLDEIEVKWYVKKRHIERFFGVSKNTLETWLQSGCPVYERDLAGRISWLYLPDVVRWHHLNRSAKVTATGATATAAADLDPIEQRARKDKEMADKLAIENQVRRSELVDVGEVRLLWAKVATDAKSRLRAVATRMAPLLVGRERPGEIQALLLKDIDRALGAAGDSEADCVRTAEEIPEEA